MKRVALMQHVAQMENVAQIEHVAQMKRGLTCVANGKMGWK